MKKLLFVLTLVTSAMMTSTASTEEAVKDCVILLHGMGRSGLSMKAVEWKLESAGYEVVNESYPSTQHPIEDLADIAITAGVERCNDSAAKSIHFVTHSLGGIVLRQYTSQQAIDKLARVVMLGPPNQGSQMADFVNTLNLTKVQPKPVAQLGTGDNSVPLSLGPVNFELGVIAGTRNVRPIISSTIDGPSDGTVLVEETKVDGMQDFLELPATHSLMMWQNAVLDQIVYFLANGEFSRAES